MNDLRLAVRQLLKNPGFAAIAVLTLALGIGANTALFSVINGVLLRPLPYFQPGGLLTLWERNLENGAFQQPVSHLNYTDWKAQNQVFETVGYWKEEAAINVVTADGVEKARCAYASVDIFAALRARPLLGRTFLPEEDRQGGNRVAVLSHDFWQRRFGGNPEVLGQPLTVDSYSRRTYTVVGVMPPEFRFPDRCEFWLPAGWSGAFSNMRDARRINVLARLKPGVQLERAQTEMNAIQARLKEQHRESTLGSQVAIVPLLEHTLGRNLKLALLVLWAVVAGVLLIACANVANLLLARAAERQEEIAVRFALGATRGRVLRQLLTESLLLSCVGGGLGILLGGWGLALIRRVSPGYVARLQDVTLDGSALFFTLLVSLLTGLIFGLAPAWQITRQDLHERLKGSARGSSAGPRASRLRDGLVVAEVALSLLLLIGAGLMLQSFVRLVHTDRGFQPDRVLTADLDFSVTGFTTWTRPTETRPQIRLQEMLDRLRAQPGVQAVGATSRLPRRRGGPAEQPMIIIGREVRSAADMAMADHSGVTPDYFRAMGIPLLRGRAFEESDRLNTAPVFIINEALAKRYFPNQDPIGQRMSFPSRTNRFAPEESYQNGFPVIVGVVADVSTLSLNPETHPHFYSPYWQYPMQSPTMTVRVAGDPAAFEAMMRHEIKAVAPGLPRPVIQTMDNILSQVVAQPRFQAWMLTLFGGVALGLAAIGLYGVLAYAVTRRRREIGVRLALGAQKRDILSLIIRHGMRLALVGVGLGVVAALGLTRVMRSLLYQVTPTDPLTFAAVTLLLVVITLAACWLPARRAAQVDPMTSLRNE